MPRLLLFHLVLAAPAASLLACPYAPRRRLGRPLQPRLQAPLAASLAVAAGPQVAVAVGLDSGLATLGVAMRQGMLTPSGLVNAWILGVLLWSTLGWRGWSTCVLYLVAGSAVTKVKRAKKEAMGIAEGRGGKRGPENVHTATRRLLLAHGLVIMFWPC